MDDEYSLCMLRGRDDYPRQHDRDAYLLTIWRELGGPEETCVAGLEAWKPGGFRRCHKRPYRPLAGDWLDR